MKRGFGLIELLLVLAVMSIAVMLVIPSVGTTASTRADAAARLLRSDIEYAQIRSIANPANPISVILAEDGSGYWLSNPDKPQTPITHEMTGEPYQVTFGEGRASMSKGVQASVEQLDKGMLKFDSLGGLTDPTVDPLYRFSCEEARVNMTVRAGTGFIQIHH